MHDQNIAVQEPINDGSVMRGWLAYVIVGVMVSLQFALQGSVSLMVPELKADLGLDEAGVGMISSLFFYPYVLLQVPSGRLLSKWGVKTLLVTAGIVMLAGCLLQSVADSVVTMILGRLIMGIGAAPMIVCFLGTIEHFFVASVFGALAASMEMFGLMGAGIGDFLIPQSIANWGWRSTLQIFGVLTLIPIILAPLVLSNRQTLAVINEGEIQDWKSVFRDTRIWIFALYSGLMFAVLNAFAALWGIPFLEADPACTGHAGQMVGMTFLGAAIGAPTQGWLADHGMNMRRAMVICAILTIMLFLAVVSRALPASFNYLLLFVLGFCSSAYVLPFVMVKHWLTGESLSVGLALTNGVSVMVGTLFYQPIIGWLISLYPQADANSYCQVLMIIPFGVALGIVLIQGARSRTEQVVPVQSEP